MIIFSIVYFFSFYFSSDPDLAPTKALQHVQQVDYGQWPQQSKSRFDTTYRSEYINRLRHPVSVFISS